MLEEGAVDALYLEEAHFMSLSDDCQLVGAEVSDRWFWAAVGLVLL